MLRRHRSCVGGLLGMEGCLWRVVLSAAGMHRVDRDNVHDMAWSFVRLVVCVGGVHTNVCCNPCSVGSVRLPYRVTVDVRGERWVRIGIGIGLCVDLMCGYRPVSCADGIAIYKPDPGVTGFPIGHARRVPRRHDGRCATSRTEHRRAAAATHRARSDPGGPGRAEGAPPRAEANYSTPLVRLSPLRSRNTHVSERNMKQQRNEAAPRNGCRCGSPGRLGPSLRPL